MKIIWEFILSMLPFMLMAIPTFLIIRFLHLKHKNIIAKVNFYHEGAYLIFVIFICGLASLTILPAFLINEKGIHFISNGSGSINIIPFKVIYTTYVMLFIEHKYSYFIINILGNIVMFMPFGFFPALLWNLFTIYKAALLGFACSLFIELFQMNISRNTDIDDIWLNVLGAIAGYLIYKLFAKKYSEKAECFKFRI